MSRLVGSPIGARSSFVTASVALSSWAAADLARLTEGKLLQRAGAAGADPTEVLRPTGDPVECISATAEEHDVDVVVVGAHDKGFLSRLFDPSVSAGVVRGTHRPVLVVSGTGPDRPDA